MQALVRLAHWVQVNRLTTWVIQNLHATRARKAKLHSISSVENFLEGNKTSKTWILSKWRKNISYYL